MLEGKTSDNAESKFHRNPRDSLLTHRFLCAEKMSLSSDGVSHQNCHVVKLGKHRESLNGTVMFIFTALIH